MQLKNHEVSFGSNCILSPEHISELLEVIHPQSQNLAWDYETKLLYVDTSLEPKNERILMKTKIFHYQY